MVVKGTTKIVQFGTSTLIHAETLAVFSTIAFAPSVKMANSILALQNSY